MHNDLKIAQMFFSMLKDNGVNVQLTYDKGPGFKILTHMNGDETLEFCFYEDGSYWRIMGTDETGFYSDNIHQDGWK